MPGGGKGRLNTVFGALWCLALFVGLVVLGAWLGATGAATNIVVAGPAHALLLAAFCHLALVTHEERPAAGWSRSTVISALGLGSAPLAEVGWGVVLGFATKAPADMLQALVERYFPPDEMTLLAQAQLLRHDSWPRVALLVLWIGLLGPLLEELFYRGVAFRLFDRGSGRRMALLLSSAFFALSHLAPTQWLPLLLVALVLGQARAQSGRLWACVAAHVTFNCVALSMVFGGQVVAPDSINAWLLVLAGCGLVPVALLALRSTPS